MSYLTPQGLRVPRENEILERIRAEYESAIGQSVDWSRDTFEGAFSVALARVEADTLESLQDLWDMFDPEAAQGIALDVQAALAGTSRTPASFSVVDLDLDGDPGTFVPAGSVVEATGGRRWITQEDVTLPGSSVAQADETGPIPAAAGTITQIVTPITGWDTVTNPAAATTGANRQSDEELRAAVRLARQRSTGSSFGGIEEQVRRLPFITNSLVVHNPSSAPAVVQGVPLPPHSYQVVVFPDTLTAEQEELLADRIFGIGPIGIESVGSESRFRAGWPVRWQYASPLSVDVAVVVTVKDGFGSAGVLLDVESAISRLLARLAVGENVRILALFGAIDRVEGVESVTSLAVQGGVTDLAVGATQFGVEGGINVSV